MGFLNTMILLAVGARSVRAVTEVYVYVQENPEVTVVGGVVVVVVAVAAFSE